MGFAGQVFAARVAIGLAFPSKQAMGQASQIIGGGAAALYKKMNSLQLQQAGKRKSLAEKSLKEMEQRIERHRSTLSQKLIAGQAKFSKSMKQANQGAKITAGRTASQYKKSQKAMGTAKGSEHIERTFKAGKRAFTDFANHVKKRSPDLAIEMFGKEDNMDKIHDNFDMDKMSALFGKEGKEAERMQKELMQIAKLEMENAQRRQRNGMEEVKMMRIKTKWLMATKQLTSTAGADALEMLDAEEQGFKDNVNAAKDFHQIVRGMSDERAQVEREHQQDTDKLLKKEKSLRQNVKDAINGETEALKLLERGAARAAKKAAQFAEALKNNFGNALRESISALTAMFYKLQQNSQELIEFERELMNANSVFNLTRDELYKTSEVITQFGQTFGMEMQNGAEGLYQLASAGLSADAAAKVLPETLKLSMAVQGDHNTIAKLTTQTLMGFSMEMEQAAEVTDKFAHVIQKSLIEYEDLTSAVKFAMPFFTATGQSLDQLLGALEVLTNRALEAGIAGRGLRQALAEFAEHADDNTAAFARMGLGIKKADGSMKDLTVIAKEYSDIIGPEAAQNTELLTALIDDLNVRGATAFVHLVQNADEFGQAVEDVANAGGELDEMVRIQNESMSAQIQILKNNVQMMFFYSDGVHRANGAMNEFHSAIIDGITGFQDLIVEGEEGNKQLTDFGHTIQDVAVEAVQALIILLQDGIKFLQGFSGQGKMALGVLKAYLLPIKVLMKAMDFMGPRVTSLVIQFSMLNKLFSLTAGIRATAEGFVTLYKYIFTTTTATVAETAAVDASIVSKTTEIGVNNSLAASEEKLAASKSKTIFSMQGQALSKEAKYGKGMADMQHYKGPMNKAGTAPDMRTKEYKAFMAQEGLVRTGERSGIYNQPKGLKTVGKGKGMPKTAKIGRMASMFTRLGTALSGAAAAMAIVVVALGVIGIKGLELMGSLEPVVKIFTDFGTWLKDSLYWSLQRISLGILQMTQSFGLASASALDMQFTTENAIKEIGWAITHGMMKFAMVIGGTMGLGIYAISEFFKFFHEIVMEYLGNSIIIDAIVGGFTHLWEKLFDPTTGWLRWMTLTWWQDAFTELSTWWNGGQVVLDTFDSALDFGQAMFGSIITFIEELPGKLIGIGASIKDAVSLTAIFGIDAFKTSWNALAAMMSNIDMQIEISPFEIAIPDWVPKIGGKGFRWDGYNESFGFGSWPQFEMAAAIASGGDGVKMDAGLMRATGGYVQAMANGGYAGNGSYIVGEKGPELFVPNQSGQVINNSRTDSILKNQLNSGRNNAGMGSGGTMYVDNLVSNVSKMGKSKISVDTFAGVI